jgi:hypothetical protein
MEDSKETHRSCIACVTREGSEMCQNQSCQRMYCDAHAELAANCCPTASGVPPPPAEI